MLGLILMRNDYFNAHTRKIKKKNEIELPKHLWFLNSTVYIYHYIISL